MTDTTTTNAVETERAIVALYREIRQRVGAMCGVSPRRVAITHEDFGTADGGEGFTITVTMPPADKRTKHDSKLHGTGDTLADAEREIARRFESHKLYEEQEAARRKRK